MKLSLSQPSITSHHYYALPLAIIGSAEHLKQWIYNQFIQIYTVHDIDDETINVRLYKGDIDMFGFEPLWRTVSTGKQLVYGDRVIEVYKAFLDSEQYIYDFIDFQFIKSFELSIHYVHDLLIYGYNDEKQTFNAYSYRCTKLKEYEIPYNEYISAYNSDCELLIRRDWVTALLRKKTDSYCIDVKGIGIYINDYINGVNSYEREGKLEVKLHKPEFGINIYKALKELVIQARDRGKMIDIPDIYCVYDHKRLMLERVLYLDKHSEVKSTDDLNRRFHDIVEAGYMLVLLAMKINQKGFESEIDINSLLKRLELLKELEEETYIRYYRLNQKIFE